MRGWLVANVVAVALGLCVGGMAQEHPPASTVLPPGPASRCVLAWAQGNVTTALNACRLAVEAGNREPRVLETLAKAELEVGDPSRAEKAYRRLIETEGWQWDLADGLAQSLWRQERMPEAEKVLREAVQRDPSLGPWHELVAFLLYFSRWKDADATAREALKQFPDDCLLHEDLGVAEAGLNQDSAAAREIAVALEDGCPPLRWTRRGVIPDRIQRPEYRKLLDPEQIAEGLASLPEGDALHRLRLLELVSTPSVAPELEDAVLKAHSAPVKLAAMHLLMSFGDRAAPQWREILASPDLMLRKHALRMLAREATPGLLPVLEEHLREEPAPHNLSLTRIAVARLLLGSGQAGKARELLHMVPKDDPSYPFAEELLAKVNGGN